MTMLSEPITVADEDHLPHGWRRVRLEDVCDIIAGQSPPGDTYRSRPEGLPFFQGKADFGPRHPVARIWCVAPTKIAIPGDILISVRAPVGPTNVADIECCIGRGLAAVRPKIKADRDFILAALQLLETTLAAKGSGSTFAAITRSELADLLIPLPPLPEQQRIADLLTRKLAAVDAARAAAEAQLAAAKALPAEYLQSLFDGPEARQWPTKSLGQIAMVVQNGIYKPAEFYGHGHAFLRMYNLANSSWIMKLDRLALVELAGDELKTFSLRIGDLLISRVNSFELVGKCAWAGPEVEGYVFENMLIRVRLDSSVDSLFVAEQMNTRIVREQIEHVAKRAIGQASINSTDLRQMRIRIPPHSTQQRIAKRVSEMARSADQVHAAVAEQLATINKLPAALLREAFSGRL